MDPKPNYYANPAFCQQSEFYPPKRALSPQRSVRQSPVGAQTSHVVFDNSLRDDCADNIEEQEFYEEVIVDDNGFIKGKKFVVVAQNNEGQKYIQVPRKKPPSQGQKTRYEYIPMQEQDARVTPRSTPTKAPSLREEHVEIIPGVVHRYAVIEAEEETELTNKNERYALVPVNQLNNVVVPQTRGSRYEYIKESPGPAPTNRYEYSPPKYLQNPPRPGTNPVATQKLHELLSTPRKVNGGRYPSSVPKVRVVSPPVSPIAKDPFRTPPKRIGRAQQKLNYAIGSKQLGQQEKRPNTAIVPPICSSPVQSIYGETTYSQKSESWMNLSSKGGAAGHTLAAAAFIMFLCGLVTAGLSFYMLSFMGRPYYLDFSTVAGFTCAVMGLLGCRSRHVYWLPNRNYLSGYLILTVFSLLTCGGLVLLLVNDPPPGTPLADMTSAAICGFAVLTLMLALTGVISSYCCKYPPPDNRVQHCSPGLTV